jgi:ATP-dependent Clp protease ATP-binding subunit ClpA
MTDDRRAKRATRTRMAQTGEKYTEARRALTSSSGDGGSVGGDPKTTFGLPEGPIGWFTDQAQNLILLAADEARMLNHPAVEPEHLLLATTRRGNAVQLLGADSGRLLHDAIEQVTGFGDKLTLDPRRSPASEQVLTQAIEAGQVRGIRDPSTEHLLLALAQHELPARLLAGIGVSDVQAIVDSHYRVQRPPVPDDIVQQRAVQLARFGFTLPRPGPMPPVFERFTSHARAAVDGAVTTARTLDDSYVQPVHLLTATLSADGIAATVRSELGWDLPPVVSPESARRRATGIFSDRARRLVAEDVLVLAARLNQKQLTTGHLLIALLESPDERTAEIAQSLPEVTTITRRILEALPGGAET